MNDIKLTDEATIDSLKEMAIKFSKDTYVNRVLVNAINLIHRLQDEKKELKSIAEYQQGSNMERWRIIQEKDKTIAEQKAEIERLTEYNENLNGMCLEFIDKKAELQKKVDELKAYAEDIYKKAIDREEDAYSLGFDKGKEQAVKDTAKEILDEVSKHYGGAWLVELYKKYGVEG